MALLHHLDDEEVDLCLGTGKADSEHYWAMGLL